MPTAGTSAQPTSGQPTGTLPPGSTEPPPSLLPPPSQEPLQAPELESPDEIAQALFQPGLEEQAVVSLLNVLGIGIYNADGSAIRAGTETSDADLYLFEPEVRGLIEMLQSTDQESDWISFRDFHAALAGLGFQGGAEELAQAYSDAYAAQPDAAMAQFVGYVDVEASFTRFTAWLLLLDGFVPPRRSLIAAVGGFVAASPAPGGGGWGVAQNNVQALQGVPLQVDPLVIAHLIGVVASSSLTITTNPSKVHEGHGGNGSPAEVTATLRAVASSFVSPFSGLPVVPVTNSPDGIAVAWNTDAVLAKHGSTNIAGPAFTDALGQAKFTYTPRKEKAGGQGVVVTVSSLVQVIVSGSDLIARMYGRPELGMLVPAQVSGHGLLNIEWHDEPPLLIDFTNTYNLELPSEVMGTAQTAGQDTISGQLIVDEDDPTRWEGTALAYASGAFSGGLMGHTCSFSWDAQQILRVTGLEDPGSGEMLFVFQPISDPIGSLGDRTCGSSGRKPPSPDGIYWIPFNDLAVTEPSIGLRFNVAIPRPGFLETDYPVPLQGTGVTGYADWHVRIEFVTP